MGRRIVLALALAAGLVAQDGARDSAAAPSFTRDGQLIVPRDYREWIFLSSGLGMTYGPLRAGDSEPPNFENVFVSPPAYRSFMQTGSWPEGTMFVLEIRHSGEKGSINNGGHYQTGVRGIEAEVKDSGRFPAKWAFFQIAEGADTGIPIPGTATCYTCHRANGAVDNTFVQFYPTLIGIARQHGTYHEPGANPGK